jgi:ABC-type lipoprotein release transport system permease subunit
LQPSLLQPALNIFLGIGVGVWWGESATAGLPPGAWVDQEILFSVIFLTPLVACLAGLLPSMRAAGQDPAVVLREE